MSERSPEEGFDRNLRSILQSTIPPTPEDVRLERFMTEFRALHAAHAQASLLQRLGNWLTLPRLVPAGAIAAIAAMLVAQSAIIVQSLTSTSPVLETWRGEAAKCSEATRLRVMFKPDAPHAEVLLLLRKTEATVSAGPSETGELWLDLPSGRPVAEAMAALKGSAWVDDVIATEAKKCP